MKLITVDKDMYQQNRDTSSRRERARLGEGWQYCHLIAGG